MLAAADTFRAAAIEQLGIWADRLGIDIVKGQQPMPTSPRFVLRVPISRPQEH